MIEQIKTILSLGTATLLVIILAYYTTIIIGKKANSLNKHCKIQMLERLSISVGVTITVMKINKKIYLLSVAGKNIQVIDIIEEKDWPEATIEMIHQNSMVEKKFFSDQVKTIIAKQVGKVMKKGSGKNDKGNE